MICGGPFDLESAACRFLQNLLRFSASRKLRSVSALNSLLPNPSVCARRSTQCGVDSAQPSSHSSRTQHTVVKYVVVIVWFQELGPESRGVGYGSHPTPLGFQELGPESRGWVMGPTLHHWGFRSWVLNVGGGLWVPPYTM